MLNAADEFSTGTAEALQQAHDSAGEIRRDATPLIDPGTNHFSPEAQRYLDAMNDAVGAVLAKRARVDLLFGAKSDAGLAASGVVENLRSMGSALDRLPESVRDRDTFSEYGTHFQGAFTQHGRFNDSARDALTTWARRLGRRLWRQLPVA